MQLHQHFFVTLLCTLQYQEKRSTHLRTILILATAYLLVLVIGLALNYAHIIHQGHVYLCVKDGLPIFCCRHELGPQ